MLLANTQMGKKYFFSQIFLDYFRFLITGNKKGFN